VPGEKSLQKWGIFSCKKHSFVTDYILSQNKIPILTTREDNIPMRKVAERIGFRLVETVEVDSNSRDSKKR
jgi:hypothetical protein